MTIYELIEILKKYDISRPVYVGTEDSPEVTDDIEVVSDFIDGKECIIIQERT